MARGWRIGDDSQMSQPDDPGERRGVLLPFVIPEGASAAEEPGSSDAPVRAAEAALAQALVGRAREHVHFGDDAIDDLERAIELDPTNCEAYFLLAITEQYGREVDLFTRAIQLDPRNAEYYRSRAEALLRDEQPVRALADCNRAIQLAPNCLGYLERARAFRAMGDLRAALLDYDRSVELGPAFGAPGERLEVLHELRDEPATLRVLETHLARHPDDVFARAYLALYYYRRRDLPRALAEATKIPARDQFDAIAYGYVLRCAFLLHLGDVTAALRQIDLALECAPNEGYYRALRGQCLLALGRLDHALAEYGAAIKRYDFEEGFRIWRARIATSLGGARALAMARADLRRVILAAPRVPSHYAERAMIYLKGGNRRRALEDLEQALALFKTSRQRFQPRCCHYSLELFERAGLDLRHPRPLTCRQVRALYRRVGGRREPPVAGGQPQPTSPRS